MNRLPPGIQGTQYGSGWVFPNSSAWPSLRRRLAWAAEQELVLHLDDLLLRRTRLGLLLACGAAAELPRIRALCQARLGWDDARWQEEEQAYRQLWQCCYSLPAEDGSRGRTAS